MGSVEQKVMSFFVKYTYKAVHVQRFYDQASTEKKKRKKDRCPMCLSLSLGFYDTISARLRWQFVSMHHQMIWLQLLSDAHLSAEGLTSSFVTSQLSFMSGERYVE